MGCAKGLKEGGRSGIVKYRNGIFQKLHGEVRWV